MAREYFKKVLEQLNNQEYKSDSITIQSYEDDEESLKNNIGDEEVILLCEALKKNPHVKNITFDLQNIGDKGAIALAEVHTLKDVIIYYGNFGVPGGCALAKSRLKGLTIEGSNIFCSEADEEKSERFIDALIDNKSIEELALSNTYIYKYLLIKLVKKTTSIKFLYLDRESFDKELFKDIEISQKEMHICAHGEEIVLFGEEMQDNNI